MFFFFVFSPLQDTLYRTSAAPSAALRAHVRAGESDARHDGLLYHRYSLLYYYNYYFTLLLQLLTTDARGGGLLYDSPCCETCHVRGLEAPVYLLGAGADEGASRYARYVLHC